MKTKTKTTIKTISRHGGQRPANANILLARGPLISLPMLELRHIGVRTDSVSGLMALQKQLPVTPMTGRASRKPADAMAPI